MKLTPHFPEKLRGDNNTTSYHWLPLIHLWLTLELHSYQASTLSELIAETQGYTTIPWTLATSKFWLRDQIFNPTHNYPVSSTSTATSLPTTPAQPRWCQRRGGASPIARHIHPLEEMSATISHVHLITPLEEMAMATGPTSQGLLLTHHQRILSPGI